MSRTRRRRVRIEQTIHRTWEEPPAGPGSGPDHQGRRGLPAVLGPPDASPSPTSASAPRSAVEPADPPGPTDDPGGAS